MILEFKKYLAFIMGQSSMFFKRLNKRTVQLLICKIMIRTYFWSELKVQKQECLTINSLVTLFDKMSKSIYQNQELFKNSVLCRAKVQIFWETLSGQNMIFYCTYYFKYFLKPFWIHFWFFKMILQDIFLIETLVYS